MKNCTLNIYNYASEKYEDIEVTEEVYTAYRRTEWNMNKNDSKHLANTIPFSNLIGGDGGAYENFREFISDENDPMNILTDKLLREALLCALNTLPNDEYRLISALYINGKTERKYAEETGIPQKTINDQKHRIILKIKKIMEFEK